MIGVLALGVVAAAVWLIVLYNHKVTYVNGVSDMRSKMQSIEAQNVEAKEKIFSLFHSGEVEQFAAELGLVREQHPEYVEISKPWVSASRY